MILLFVFIVCNASIKGKYKSIELACRMAEIIQRVLHSPYMCMYLILIRRVETCHKTN